VVTTKINLFWDVTSGSLVGTDVLKECAASIFMVEGGRWKVEGGSSMFILLIIYLVCEAIGNAATPGLLCQPRVVMKMIVEKQMECRLAGETEVLGENLPEHHFCPSQNPI
jgi:hypothetical protein